MSLIDLVSDAYERKARLYPALMLIAPVVATGVALVSTKFTGLQSVVSGIVGCGGAFLLTQLARDAGKNREPALYKRWGGMPSIAIFRHAHSRLDSITKGRYHKQLTTLVKGTKAPTSEQEAIDPAAADQVYAAWSHFLRVRARENAKKFPRVFDENVNYGYRRNVFGLRPVGIGVTLICCLVAGVRLFAVHKATGEIAGELAWALGFSALLFFLWAFRFTASWVRVPADEYAARLAETVEAIPKAPAKQEEGGAR
jgi:hypothetical protein